MLTDFLQKNGWAILLVLLVGLPFVGAVQTVSDGNTTFIVLNTDWGGVITSTSNSSFYVTTGPGIGVSTTANGTAFYALPIYFPYTNSTPVCSNGVLEPGEQCDNGALNGACPAACSATCSLNVCGGGYGGGYVPPPPLQNITNTTLPVIVLPPGAVFMQQPRIGLFLSTAPAGFPSVSCTVRVENYLSSRVTYNLTYWVADSLLSQPGGAISGGYKQVVLAGNETVNQPVLLRVTTPGDYWCKVRVQTPDGSQVTSAAIRVSSVTGFDWNRWVAGQNWGRIWLVSGILVFFVLLGLGMRTYFKRRKKEK